MKNSRKPRNPAAGKSKATKPMTAVITGAGSGLGAATAKALAGRGTDLVICGRRRQRLEELAELLRREYGTKVLCTPADVRHENDVARVFEAAVHHFGRVDILINNAGGGLRATVAETDFKDWQQVQQTNVDGVFLCSRAAVRQMSSQAHTAHPTRLPRIRGRIITISSIAGRFSAPHYAAYCAAKHAVTGFMGSLRREVRKERIRCTTLHPARIDTEFFANYPRRPSRRQLLPPTVVARHIAAIAEGRRAARFGTRLCALGIRLRRMVFG